MKGKVGPKLGEVKAGKALRGKRWEPLRTKKLIIDYCIYGFVGLA
jgi:hypothetical protein